jgi:UDP-GlcNAc3NAcA epimerase
MATPLRVLSIIGARPQIIKAAAISRAMEARKKVITHTILHTGQHYDAAMSQVFFEELGIPPADLNLGIGSGSHGVQTARMIEAIEAVLQRGEHDVVLLYGDTNSTLAGALAAVKLHIPVAHVEAGLRSFNKSMPEEINRIVCDQCSSWLFCPTSTAVTNLEREGYSLDGKGTPEQPIIDLCGDVMFDNSMHFATMAEERSTYLAKLGLAENGFILATVHRDHNTDDPTKLTDIVRTLIEMHEQHALPIVLPLHPRAKKNLPTSLPGDVWERLQRAAGIHVVPPVGFLDMIALERNARLVITDSGGVQKEAFFFGKPCVILRSETEWVELVEHGQAQLVGADPASIHNAVSHFLTEGLPSCPPLFGDGKAAERICDRLLAYVR